jgi:hypothetical protein
MLEKLATHDI